MFQQRESDPRTAPDLTKNAKGEESPAQPDGEDNSDTTVLDGSTDVTTEEANSQVQREDSIVGRQLHAEHINAPTASCGRLDPGQALGRGQSISSCNGSLRLVHQLDGNVVAYDAQGALWSTGTAGRATTAFVMQPDGNLVLYNNNVALWSTGTHNSPGAFLAIQDDCNLVIYHGSNVRWASNTFCRVATLDPYRFDPTAPWNGGANCLRREQVGAQALQSWVDANYGGTSWGIYSCRVIAGTNIMSAHGEGRALDWKLDANNNAERAEGDRLFNDLTRDHSNLNANTLVRRMGIQSIIWKSSLWDARVPTRIQNYPGMDHFNHLHIEMNWRGARKETSYWR